MPSTAEIVKRYFAALSAHDVDAAAECWKPGAVARLVGTGDLIAPDGIRAYFSMLFGAFPDFELEVLELTTARGRTAVRWRGRGTFAGPGKFQGFVANHARLSMEGCDVVTVEDGLIVRNDAYVDTGDVARQLGLLPAAGSATEARLAKLANLRSRAMTAMRTAEPERIADGVWLVRGGFPVRLMNVYLIEDTDGLTVFDAGIAAMGEGVNAACARLGGVKRVILGHADADHRGAAPALDAPVYCHPAERAAAESDDSFRTYYDIAKLKPHTQPFFRKMLPSWDGGPVQVAGTVAENDEVAGFRVIDVPGHAPGLIALFREADRVALVSDLVYTLDVQSGRKGGPRVPHPAFDLDVEQARASIRKLAELDPSVVWAGHADPVTGDVAGQLQRAASAPL
jgi:hydroxyacylglutathione hydrolase